MSDAGRSAHRRKTHKTETHSCSCGTAPLLRRGYVAAQLGRPPTSALLSRWTGTGAAPHRAATWMWQPWRLQARMSPRTHAAMPRNSTSWHAQRVAAPTYRTGHKSSCGRQEHATLDACKSLNQGIDRSHLQTWRRSQSAQLTSKNAASRGRLVVPCDVVTHVIPQCEGFVVACAHDICGVLGSVPFPLRTGHT